MDFGDCCGHVDGRLMLSSIFVKGGRSRVLPDTYCEGRLAVLV